MEKIQKAQSGRRIVDTPVITKYVNYPNDTTFMAHTPGQLISDVDVKLDGNNSVFRLYSPGDDIGTKVKKGDQDWQMYYDRYKKDFEEKKKQGDVKYKNSLFKSIWSLFPHKEQEGGFLNYLNYFN